jgi:hypothetical protein
MRLGGLVACLVVLGSLPAAADDPAVKVGGLIDVRYAHTDDLQSWLDGGQGKFRYGAGVDGAADLLRLSQVSLLVDAEVDPVLGALPTSGSRWRSSAPSPTAPCGRSSAFRHTSRRRSCR